MHIDDTTKHFKKSISFGNIKQSCCIIFIWRPKIFLAKDVTNFLKHSVVVFSPIRT
jgi:hypothetical protein